MSGIVNVMCLVITVAACLLILLSFETVIIAQWAKRSPDYKMLSNIICMHTVKNQHQSFLNWGLFFSSTEVSGFLQDQFHVKGNGTIFLEFP